MTLGVVLVILFMFMWVDEFSLVWYVTKLIFWSCFEFFHEVYFFRLFYMILFKVMGLIICLMIYLIFLSSIWLAGLTTVISISFVRRRGKTFNVTDLITFLMTCLIILGAFW